MCERICSEVTDNPRHLFMYKIVTERDGKICSPVVPTAIPRNRYVKAPELENPMTGGALARHVKAEGFARIGYQSSAWAPQHVGYWSGFKHLAEARHARVMMVQNTLGDRRVARFRMRGRVFACYGDFGHTFLCEEIYFDRYEDV